MPTGADLAAEPELQAESPNRVEDSDTPTPDPPRQTKRPRAAVADGSVVQAILESAQTSGEAAGFTMVPNLLIHGEIGARLERLRPGTAWLVAVLLRFAERKDHVIKASKATLRRLTGIAKDETLDKRLQQLARKHKALGFPRCCGSCRGAAYTTPFARTGLPL